MPSEEELQLFELEMHNNRMNACANQNFNGSCSEYGEDYCIYEEDQLKCPEYHSIRKSEEFFESRRNKK